MGGLDHDFLLVALSDFSYFDYLKLIRKRGAVHLHDDLMRYMADSFHWIPSFNVARKKKELLPSQGFHFYGPTIIRAEGAAVLEKVLSAWASLFSCGPELLELTGSFMYEHPPEISDDGITVLAIDDASYSRLAFPRDQVVARLNRIIRFCQKVRQKPDEFYILHLGV